MSSPALAYSAPEPLETPVERIRRLEAEARRGALAEKDELLSELQTAALRCADLSTLDSLPAGIREAFRAIGAGIEAGLQSAQAVAIRSSGQ